MRCSPQGFVRTLLATSVVLSCSALAAQTQNANPPQAGAPSVTEKQRGKLALGKPIEQVLMAGESDVYTMKVKKGQFVHIVVEQKGTPLSVSLVGPAHQKSAESEAVFAGWDSVPISMIATATAVYQVSVESQDKKAPAGNYQIALSELRKPRPLDQTRIDAERAEIAGAQLFEKRDEASVRSAIEIWDKSLPLWRSLQDRYEEAVTSAAIGTAYRLVADFPKAIDYLSKSLGIFRTLGDRHDETVVLMNLGIVSSEQGRKQEALDYHTEAQRILEALGDRRSLATAYHNIGAVYDDLGQYQKALSYYLQALDIARAIGDLQSQASVLADLGRVNRRLGNMEKALDYYGQALPLVRVVDDRRSEGVILNNSGLVYLKLGDVPKALELFAQALPIRRELGDRYGEISTLINIGSAYWSLGDHDKSLDYSFQALAIAQAAGFRKDEGDALMNLGSGYDRLDEKTKALDYYLQALSVRREVGDRAGEANTLLNIGALYYHLDDMQEALDYERQALTIAQTIGARPLEASALTNAANVLRAQGETQKALDYCDQALDLRRAVGDRSGEAVTLASIGLLYSDLREMQKALDYLNQAVALDRAVGDRPDEAWHLLNLGMAHERLGEKQEAQNDYVQALSLSRAVKSVLLQGNILAELMEHWQRANRLPLAIFFGKQAINAYQQVRSNTQGLQAELQQSFLQSKAGKYRALADLLIAQGRLFEAQEVLDLLKEQEYFEFIRRDGRSADSLTKPVALTPAEQKTYEEYQRIADQVTASDAEWTSLHAKTSRTPDQESHMNDLGEKLKVANANMEIYFQKLYTEFAENESADKKSGERIREDASGVQSLIRDLGPGTIALYTLVTEAQYRVIVITPNAMQPREFAISQADLRRKVAALLTALEDPKSDPLPASQELYRVMIGPIEQDLRGAKAKTLMWSLDDVLRYVPIAALNDGKQYMVENYRNVVFTPASVGRLKDAPSAKNGGGLGMGVSKDYDGLGALPQVPAELRGIIHDEAVEGSNGVIPGTMMLDDTFTEKNMATALEQRHRLVHIASHFVLKPGNETDSYLLIGGKDEGGKGYHLTLAELRTDPRLTFSDTDLLTLSACQTATSGSAADGHEVDGLGIMAQQRGAKAVMATLWSVEDESTGLLMADFYALWIDHPEMNKGEALRQAQMAMLHGKQPTGTSRRTDETHAQGRPNSQAAFAHPYFWAPFVLIGNWK
jgi:CHAT domain-containing protein/Tfp pilus assembly protein PilF